MILFLSNMLSAFPGCTLNMDARSAQPKPILEFWPALVPRSAVQQMVHFADQSFTISEPIPLLHPSAVPKQPSYEPTLPVPLSQFGPTVRAPLGHVVYARSGDKGPNVNVGFFCTEKTPRTQWDWLRSFLTTSRLRALLGNDMTKVTGIERCEFPQIGAVHFVIHGVLGTGVGTTSELDALGKVRTLGFFHAGHSMAVERGRIPSGPTSGHSQSILRSEGENMNHLQSKLQYCTI